MGKAKTLVGGPPGMHDENAQDDPIVPPAHEWLGPTGDERVVVHAGAVNGQPTFTTQGIIDGEQQGAARTQDLHNEDRQEHVEGIEVPGGIAEEAMEACPMAVADVASREDDIGNKAMAMGEN